ncbi:MAG: restriction endonuclease subunit S [bacterium]
MSFREYPKYRQGGVGFGGRVPDHWSIMRLRFAAELNASKIEISSIAKGTRVSFLPMAAIGDNGCLSLDSEKTIGEVESGYTYLRDGDVVVAKITPCYENGKGAFVQGLVNGIGFGTTELIVVRPRHDKVTGAYLHYLFTSSNFRNLGVSYMYGAGGQKRVPDDFVRNYFAALPPIAEQAQIVMFLDRETAKIDELVAEQRRLMALLKEKRQAVISHAVTKGLNPDAPMKSSGVEWLGDVPAHWALRRLKTLAGFTTSGPRGWSERTGEEGALFIQSGDLTDNLTIDFSDAKRVLVEDNAEAVRTRLNDGDIVVCITGAKTGNVAVCNAVSEPAYINQHLCLIRLLQDVMPMFLGLSLSGNVGQIHFELSQYGLKQGLGLEDIGETAVPLPPWDEQHAIAKYLAAEIARVDDMAAAALGTIRLLHERRSALISAAVTGQIDVRGLAEPVSARSFASVATA